MPLIALSLTRLAGPMLGVVIRLMLVIWLCMLSGCGRTSQQMAADRIRALGCDVRFRPVGQSFEVFWIEAAQRPQAADFVTTLEKFPSLETLILANTNCSTDELSRLPVMPQLKMLDLSGNGLLDASCRPLTRFTSLEALIMDDNPLTDECLTVLSQLRNLKALSLRSTQITCSGREKLQAALPGCLLILTEKIVSEKTEK